MSGLADADHATISSLPKSCTGAKQALPQGCLNPVASAPIFCHGPSAAKSRPMTLPDVSPTAPLHEPYLWQSVSRRMPQRAPISRIILSTVLSAMRAPGPARRHMATRRRPHPSAAREKISAAAPRGSGRVGPAGRDGA